MSIKSLKKQLMAAIAMVLVAAIALGSSTYAWFVSNNSVDATISTISAQSNAPFLKITSGTGTITKDTGTTYSYNVGPHPPPPCSSLPGLPCPGAVPSRVNWG